MATGTVAGPESTGSSSCIVMDETQFQVSGRKGQFECGIRCKVRIRGIIAFFRFRHVFRLYPRSGRSDIVYKALVVQQGCQ